MDTQLINKIHKQIPSTINTRNGEGEEYGQGVVEIVISKYGVVDADNDIIVQGAFDASINDTAHFNRIKHLYQHETDEILGAPIKLYNSGANLVAVSAINLAKECGQDVYNDYKFFAEMGKTLEHSVGFTLEPNDRVWNSDKSASEIRKATLWEYSTVTWGANKYTPLLSIKQKNDLNQSEAVQMLQSIQKQIVEMYDFKGYSDTRLTDFEQKLTLLDEKLDQFIQQMYEYRKTMAAKELINKLSQL